MVSNDPANLVRFAIGPQQLADLPHVVTPAAMRATGELPAAMQREWDDIVIVISHGLMVGQCDATDCDRALMESFAASRCSNFENQVRCVRGDCGCPAAGVSSTKVQTGDQR